MFITLDYFYFLITLTHNMKKNFFAIAGFASMAALFSFGVLDPSGKTGYTGAPGEGNCTSCHSGAVNSGPGSVSISAIPDFSAGYTPGQAYVVSLTILETGRSLFGFDVVALDSLNKNAGTLAVSNTTQTRSAVSGGRTNITHKTNGGASANSHTFDFKWTAPAAANAHGVTFYASAMAANKNGNSGGDNVYTSTLSLQPVINSAVTKSVLSADWTVAPNPATDQLSLTYSLRAATDVSVRVISLDGKIVYTQALDNTAAGTQTLRIPLNEIHAGLYYVALSAGNTTFTKTVLVQ